MRLLSTAQFRLDLGTPQNLSNTLWACASLGHVPERDWMGFFYDAVDAHLKDFGPQDVSNTLWALAFYGSRLPIPESKKLRARQLRRGKLH